MRGWAFDGRLLFLAGSGFRRTVAASCGVGLSTDSCCFLRGRAFDGRARPGSKNHSPADPSACALPGKTATVVCPPRWSLERPSEPPRMRLGSYRGSNPPAFTMWRPRPATLFDVEDDDSFRAAALNISEAAALQSVSPLSEPVLWADWGISSNASSVLRPDGFQPSASSKRRRRLAVPPG